LNPRINFDSKIEVGNINQWKWEVNGNDFSNVENPDFISFTAGNYSLNLTATSNIGCVSNSFENNFIIKPKPAISLDVNDGCKNIPIIFNAQQTDNLTSIKSWHWDFGDNNFSDQKNTQNIFNEKGNYNVLLEAEATNGCTTSVFKNLFINEADANAGSDTLVASNTIFQLNGSGGSSYSWMPTNGLNDPNISNPTGKIFTDTKYVLTAKTVEGCVDTSSVNVTIFKGSAIYVPTAFTPNNDGLNDILKPYYVSIKSLSYFTIYNRWGQNVFSTNDLNKGWDGFSKNKKQFVGSYVWVLKAVDAIGRVYNLKGSFVLLK
jgi:gliding motility-associated-like protein